MKKRTPFVSPPHTKRGSEHERERKQINNEKNKKDNRFHPKERIESHGALLSPILFVWMLRMASSAVQFKRALTLLTVIIFSLTLLTLLSFSIIGQILCPPFIVQAQQKQASSPCHPKHCPYSTSEQKQSTKVNNNNINNNNNNNNTDNNMKVRKKCMFDGSASRNLICTVQLLTFTVLRALILATLPTVGINGTIVSPDNASNSLHDNSHASNEYFIHVSFSLPYFSQCFSVVTL